MGDFLTKQDILDAKEFLANNKNERLIVLSDQFCERFYEAHKERMDKEVREIFEKHITKQNGFKKTHRKN